MHDVRLTRWAVALLIAAPRAGVALAADGATDAAAWPMLAAGATFVAFGVLAAHRWRRLRAADAAALRQACDEAAAARRTAEAAREQLAETLDALPDLYFELDADGLYLDVHTGQDGLLAAPRQTLAGRRVDEVLPPEAARTVHEALAAAACRGSDYGRCFALDMAGAEHWFELSVTRARARPDLPARFIVLSRDISVRKQADLDRARYRSHLEEEVARRTADLAAAIEEQEAIFDSASVGIVLLKARRIVRTNRRMDEMFGYPAGAQVGQATRIWYASDADWAAVGEEVASLVWAGRTHRRELEVQRRDGSRFWVRMSGRAIDLAQPEKGMVGIIEDITAERAAAEEMQRARQLAEEAARVKADFLANMSHEIRTPMNAIVGMAYLTLRTGLTERQRGYVEKIQVASQHLLGIINDILDFSKIEAGKLVVEHVPFTLDRVLDNVAGLIAGKTAEKELELIVDVADEVPNALVGDPLRVGQILINFANNAVKFTARGEVAIRVTRVADCAGDVMLRFAVSDTGIGIADDQRGRLFRSFEQADTSTTRKYGGTGLGLAISKRLAELMGGEVGFDSTLGFGSTFWFTVRLGRGAAQPRRFVPHADLVGRRMLVVDDNAHARDVLGEMLRRMSFAVTAVESGAAALDEIVRAERAGAPFAVVFLDWQMPERDGIATAGDIRALGLLQPPALVIVTAYGRDELIDAAEHAQIRDVLIKPVTASQLFDTVVRLLSDAGADMPRPGAVEPAPLAADLAPIAGARILLVEDNELNQHVATEMLSQAGLEVDVAENGAVALEQVARHDYALVLMDMQMPVMDGLTATREIRRQPDLAWLPIVAMTANAMSGDRDRCLAAGMQDHIAKPIDPAQLWSVLRRWIAPRQVPAPMRPPAAPAPAGALPTLRDIEGLDVAAGVR
ncbi:response regulator, partial [Zoogloea sp.]|uniref:response regulator n=1 Tax=Zoogloea sp. TaxID=49181 RepID=UPI0035B34DCA